MGDNRPPPDGWVPPPPRPCPCFERPLTSADERDLAAEFDRQHQLDQPRHVRSERARRLSIPPSIVLGEN